MTQTRLHLDADAAAYLAIVDGHLADLSPEDRADLTTPVQQRLLELPHATVSRRHLEELYGAPESLANELRSAAGYPAPAAASASRLHMLGTQLSALRSRRPPRAIDAYIRSLQPAWWGLRGFLLVGAAIGFYRGQSHSIGLYNESFMTTPHLNAVWVIIPVVAIIVSVIWGHLTPRLPRSLQLLTMALSAIAAFTLFAFPTWWVGPTFAFWSGIVH